MPISVAPQAGFSPELTDPTIRNNPKLADILLRHSTVTRQLANGVDAINATLGDGHFAYLDVIQTWTAKQNFGTVTVGTLASNLLPDSASTRNIGSAALPIQIVYANVHGVVFDATHYWSWVANDAQTLRLDDPAGVQLLFVSSAASARAFLFDADVDPLTTLGRNLGSSTRYWNALYTPNIDLKVNGLLTASNSITLQIGAKVCGFDSNKLWLMSSYTVGGVPAGQPANTVFLSDAKSITDGAAAGSVAVGAGNGTMCQWANAAWRVM